jgi:hypothetical protein
MRKLIIMTGATLGALSIGSLGASGAVSAAGNHASADARPAHHPLPAGEDEGDDDGEDNGGTVPSSGGGSEASGGSGSLAATGIDASSLALIGALTLAVGGATYRVAMRRNPQR